jgi:hypothetical protein
MSRLNDGTPGNDQLRLSGARFHLGPPTSFADLDPVSDGIRLVLSGPAGMAADLVLPPGTYGGRGTAGWSASGGARPKWTFTDATGPGGKIVRRATIVDRTRPTDILTAVDVMVQANVGSFPIEPDDLPLAVDVILGDATAATAGACATAMYTPDSARPTVGCVFRGGDKTLNCKK